MNAIDNAVKKQLERPPPCHYFYYVGAAWFNGIKANPS